MGSEGITRIIKGHNKRKRGGRGVRVRVSARINTVGMGRGRWVGSITGVYKGVLGMYEILIIGISMSVWWIFSNRRSVVHRWGEIDCGYGVNSRSMCCTGGKGLM